MTNPESARARLISVLRRMFSASSSLKERTISASVTPTPNAIFSQNNAKQRETRHQKQRQTKPNGLCSMVSSSLSHGGQEELEFTNLDLRKDLTSIASFFFLPPMTGQGKHSFLFNYIIRCSLRHQFQLLVKAKHEQNFVGIFYLTSRLLVNPISLYQIRCPPKLFLRLDYPTGWLFV